MKYEELLEMLQAYMHRSGFIKGYASEQEIRAYNPCHEAVKRISSFGDFSIKQSCAAGRFYDIYATVNGQNINIGYFGNNGTIRPQNISVWLYDIDKYGSHDLNTALYEIAKDRLVKSREKALISYEKKIAELETIKESLEDIEKKLENIETALIKSSIISKEKRCRQPSKKTSLR